MFEVNPDGSIHITRGDVGLLSVFANVSKDEPYIFKPDDVVRLQVFEKGAHDKVVLTKEIDVTKRTMYVDITLESQDTKIGGIINSPVDYWYEVELNPDTVPQTIIGYDTKGPKIFRLYPEGDDTNV